MLSRRRAEPDAAVRITSASRPRSEDIRGRERRYLISMGIRTLCFILAVVFMNYWVMWVFLAGSVFLPYAAVIIANAGVTPDPAGPDFEYQADLRALSEKPNPAPEP